MKASIADRIQATLRQEILDGWLFYSFRGSDPISEHILQLDHARPAMRGWFYFVPAVGEPTRLVHAIESEMLDALPGKKMVYLSWQQIHSHIGEILAGSRRVAIQYSPLRTIPFLARVVQMVEAVWTAEQVETYPFAAAPMRQIAGDFPRGGSSNSREGSHGGTGHSGLHPESI